MTTIPPIPIDHEQLASTIMASARESAQSVPGFVFAAKGRRRKITTSASVPDSFLEAVAVACVASPHLSEANEITPAELRACITFSRAYKSVANEYVVIARGLLDTVAEHRNSVAQRARRVYSMVKDLNHPEERELLVPHAEDMRRTLGRGRPKRVKVPAPGTPAPSTQPPPVPPKAA